MSPSAAGAFKTVTVAVQGCRVQRFRICVGNRPEDIQLWIAERRKRFPRQKQAEEATVVASTNTVAIKTIESNNTTGLSGLLEGYGSSSDDADSVNGKIQQLKDDKSESVQEESPPQHAESATMESSGVQGAGPDAPPYRTRLCRYFSRSGKCRNGDNCSFLHEMTRSNERDTNSKRQKIISTNNNKPQSSSLLGKLLVNDVQRETMLTLQLLEYIVDHDFLQCELSST